MDAIMQTWATTLVSLVIAIKLHFTLKGGKSGGVEG